jgi:pumilio family protein 6
MPTGAPPKQVKNKKRPAKTSVDVSKAKKVRVVARDVVVPVVKAPPKKRRSGPVTVSSDDDDAPDSGDDDDDDGDLDLSDDGGGDEGGSEGDLGGDAVVVGDDGARAREQRKTQKTLHAQRRASRPHAALIAEAKRVWSLARQKKIPTSERQAHVQELMTAIRGHVKDLVLKRDASRIVQTVVKYGGQQERSEIATELKGQFRDLSQNRYSKVLFFPPLLLNDYCVADSRIFLHKFLVSKLIRLCPAHRSSILTEFQSHVLRLLLHREASSVLADAFELYANAYERALLLRDFYGKEATLFTVTAGSEADRERVKKGLRGILEGADPERRKRIMNAVKDNLMSMCANLPFSPVVGD